MGCAGDALILCSQFLCLSVHHNLVLSVLWSMLSTNSCHCLLLRSDVALVISSFIVDSRGEVGSCWRGRLTPPSWLRSPLGLVACVVSVFQRGYDEEQPSIVSLGTTSRLSDNQLEDDESSACILYLACIRLTPICQKIDLHLGGSTTCRRGLNQEH